MVDPGSTRGQLTSSSTRGGMAWDSDDLEESCTSAGQSHPHSLLCERLTLCFMQATAIWISYYMQVSSGPNWPTMLAILLLASCHPAGLSV